MNKFIKVVSNFEINVGYVLYGVKEPVVLELLYRIVYNTAVRKI